MSLAMLDNHANTPLKYCLYARKSSESDERQAMSIDSQLAEMRAMAQLQGLNVVCELQESHSAKDSGQRPIYNKLLNGLRTDEYNAVLTWAPDRLSRNAGDLGSIVDLMDQGKLLHIRTYSQTFTNNPNEKDIVKGVEIDIRYLLDKIMTWFRFNPSVMRLLINSNEHGCKLEADKLLKVGNESYSLQCKIVQRN